MDEIVHCAILKLILQIKYVRSVLFRSCILLIFSSLFLALRNLFSISSGRSLIDHPRSCLLVRMFTNWEIDVHTLDELSFRLAVASTDAYLFFLLLKAGSLDETTSIKHN